MYVSRFLIAAGLAVAVALGGVWLERSNLRQKQAISLDIRRLELLEEEHARLRLEVSRLGATPRLLARLREGTWSIEEPNGPADAGPRPPVRLYWRGEQP
jgi:hypothetical protein